MGLQLAASQGQGHEVYSCLPCAEDIFMLRGRKAFWACMVPDRQRCTGQPGAMCPGICVDAAEAPRQRYLKIQPLSQAWVWGPCLLGSQCSAAAAPPVSEPKEQSSLGSACQPSHSPLALVGKVTKKMCDCWFDPGAGPEMGGTYSIPCA